MVTPTDPARLPEAVTAEWLHGALGRPDLRLVDATWLHPSTGGSGRAEYEGGHLSGAVHFDIDRIADSASGLPHMLPDAARFAEAVGALGIGTGDTVVVYDRSGGGGAAARVWWTFRVFGHTAVTVLDGGLDQWVAAGGALTRDVPDPAPRSFDAHWVPALVRDRRQVIDIAASRAAQVIDARSARRFAGLDPEPWPHHKRGHIPGAINLPWTEVLDPATRTLLPRAALERVFHEAGLAFDRPVVASCGSGVTACVLAWGLARLGLETVAVYDGSWAEWGLADDTPVA